MGLFRKGPKPVKEPQYYRSVTNVPTLNYSVYYMSFFERLMYFIVGFVVGALVGYLFYGGIGKDEFGDPTLLTRVLDITISGVIGIIAGVNYIPIRTKQIIAKRLKKLNRQFRDMLEAFNTSLGAGRNVPDSLSSIYQDMRVQYEEDAFILNELEVIITGMANNFDIEDLLSDFGRRSGIDDIMSFANVFRICYREGGNIKDTIRNTHEILSDKMEIREDIETIITANKNEQNIMVVMPIALIGMIKMMSPDFASNFTTITGIIATTVAVVLFVIAHFVGKAVLDIKL